MDQWICGTTLMGVVPDLKKTIGCMRSLPALPGRPARPFPLRDTLTRQAMACPTPAPGRFACSVPYRVLGVLPSCGKVHVGPRHVGACSPCQVNTHALVANGLLLWLEGSARFNFRVVVPDALRCVLPHRMRLHKLSCISLAKCILHSFDSGTLWRAFFSAFATKTSEILSLCMRFLCLAHRHGSWPCPLSPPGRWSTLHRRSM
mmetsp:Transcript_59975/g.98951  ORF Transcript_59975/g.98951 Transcript_59975/m.98951 type:complete len:204 (-) Transcript_59975:376-987(-)